jgi:hypothetical protein
MKTVHAPLNRQNRFAALLSALLFISLFSASAAAQSTDAEFPTPIRTNEISGTIAPRDLGDPRLTRYFYSFTGTPGDLIVTVDSRNLEGDVDVFTAGTLRPLAKVSVYAGSSASGGSKTIYLKTRESLVLRVEARTPNDNNGSFRVRFDGGFEPIGSDVPDPEPVIPTVSSVGKGRRVTATGARIEEPEPLPTAADSKPETTTAATPTETTAPAETGATTAAASKPAPKPKPTRIRRTVTPRNTRTRPPTTARRKPPTPTPAEPAPATEPTEPVVAAGPRLIIETRDGMKVERYMTTVRRVTVENGQLVVITKDGHVERQPMTNVLRMAIEP